MTILKVQLNDEIRRITLDSTCFSLIDLEAKVRLMFPQLSLFTMSFRDDDNNLIQIKSEEDLHLGCAQANARFPPIFRVLITETSDSSVQDIIPTNQEQTESEEGASTSTSEDEVSIQGACSDCHAKFSVSASRFKCMNCLEVVLCESCESKCVHNPIHLLVKLRQPSSQLSLQQQLIFTSYIEDSKEKLIAKAQNKVIRRALREADENSRKKKEERNKARKERMKRRAVSRCKKLEENRGKCEKLRLKKAAAIVKESTEELPALEPFPLIVAPLNVVDPIKDSSPQPLVEEVIKEHDQTVLDVTETPLTEEKDQSEVFVDIETSECVEEKPETKVEEGEQETQPWNVLGMTMNSFKLISGRSNTETTSQQSVSPSQLKISDYRIQGFSFAKKLDELEAMGFTDKSKNIVVLMKHFSNLERAIDELTSK